MRSARHLARLAATLALTGIFANCGGSPTVPTPPASTTTPQGAGANPSRPVLTGVVFEAEGQSRRVLPGAEVIVVDLVEGPYGNYPWFSTTTDANGRFTVSAFARRTVKVTAFEKPGVGGLWTPSDLFQTRAVHPTVDTDAIVEIELDRRGTQPGSLDSPVLSGVVFETTTQGRQPAADMAVLYSSNGH